MDHQPISRSAIIASRLYVGFIVLVGAEIFSGSSAGINFFTLWTWLVTYWLYFLHFFFFINLAVRTQRTSFRALYFWGVLYGLYEGPLTKVIWDGFNHDGKLALAGDAFSGAALGHGIAEMSMVLLWHPFASFLLPLCAATLLMPELRGMFPAVDAMMARSRLADRSRIYAIATFSLTLPAALSFRYGAYASLLVLLTWLAVLGMLGLAHRRCGTLMKHPGAGRAVLIFQPRGFYALCFFMALMYVWFYFYLLPDGLPGWEIQAITLAIYAMTGLAVWLAGKNEFTLNKSAQTNLVDEDKRFLSAFYMIAAGSTLLSAAALIPGFVPLLQGLFIVNVLLWSLLGPAVYFLALTSAFLKKAAQEESRTD